MRSEQRKLWLLPWIEERNAVACAAQAILSAAMQTKPGTTGAKPADILEAVKQGAQLIDVWHQKLPIDHDKNMLAALETLADGLQSYDMRQILREARDLTKRAMTNDLSSNARAIELMMSTVMYSTGVPEIANDAMAKWRFFDATGRRKMDEELRAAFEAYWLAGEYAAGYAFVGAQWPEEWTMRLELLDDEDLRPAGAFGVFGTGAMAVSARFYTYGLISRTVQ